MTVSELKEYLSKFNDDEKITFYFLKDNVLTFSNVNVESFFHYANSKSDKKHSTVIISYSMMSVIITA